jgi:branched-chain amino acid transport system substrate-binding protein
LEGSYFVSHFSQENPSPETQKFVQKYKATFGGESPDGLAALGYDAALVLADSLKRARSFSSKDLRDAIASTQDFSGVTGKITMDANRNAVKPAVVFKLGQSGNAKLATSVKP